MPIRVLATLSKLRGRLSRCSRPSRCCVSSALLRDRVLPWGQRGWLLCVSFFADNLMKKWYTRFRQEELWSLRIWISLVMVKPAE